jgi:hypothetical protein
MRRGGVILLSACLYLVLGCRDYDYRLGQTLDEMKYQQKLEKNLEQPSTKGSLEKELIYLRTPKGLSPTKTFTLVAVEQGKFDLENSFLDEAKTAGLHVLARHKKPKAPPKKGAATPPPAAPQGEFTAEVIELLKTAYGVEDLTPSKFKATSKRHAGRENQYKEAKLNLNTKEVLVYLYGEKNGPYNVALIFEYPKAEASTASSKINLSLESFAVGEIARRAFSGGGTEEGGQEGAEGGNTAVPI